MRIARARHSAGPFRVPKTNKAGRMPKLLIAAIVGLALEAVVAAVIVATVIMW